jgi:hypothetical protein
MTTYYRSKISRRTTLQWFMAAVAASGAHRLPAAMQKSSPQPIAKGYGTDPDLNHPSIPWPRTMTPQQLQMTAVLADIILPASDNAQAPSAIGIPEFVDEWISAPYPEQQADRTVFLAGFEWLEAESRRRSGRGFLDSDTSSREQLFEVLIPKRNSAPTLVRESFFRRFRYVVVGSYYTSLEGFKDIGYVGNVALPSYPPVTQEERAILDEELRHLGIEQV